MEIISSLQGVTAKMKILALIIRNLVLFNNRNRRLFLSTTDQSPSTGENYNNNNHHPQHFDMNYTNEKEMPMQLYKLVPITKEEATRLPIDQIVIGNEPESYNESNFSAASNTFTSYFDDAIMVLNLKNMELEEKLQKKGELIVDLNNDINRIESERLFCMIYESYQRFRAHTFYEYEKGPIVGNSKIDNFMEAAKKTKLFTKNEIVNWMIDFDGSKEMKLLKELRNKYSHFTTDDIEILRQWRTKLLEDSVGASGDTLLIIDASITILNRVINYNCHPSAKPIKSLKQIKKEFDNREKLNHMKKHHGPMKIKVTKKGGNCEKMPTPMLSKKQRKRLARKARNKLSRTESSWSKFIHGSYTIPKNNFLIENCDGKNKEIKVEKVEVDEVSVSPNLNFQVTEMPKDSKLEEEEIISEIISEIRKETGKETGKGLHDEIKEYQKITPKQTKHCQETMSINSRDRTNKIIPKMAEIQRLTEENENN